MTDGHEHPLHQMVSSLCHDDSDPAVLPSVAEEKGENGPGPSIFEHDPPFQPIQFFLIRNPAHLSQIGSWDGKFWMGKKMRQVSIVGKNEQAFSIKIEPTHRIDPPLHSCEEIHDRASSLGVFHGA